MFKPKKFYGVIKPIPLTRRRNDFKFVNHECSNECSTLEKKLLEDNPTKFKITCDSILMYDHSPFLVPLFLEFKRKNDIEDNCGYLTPCGIELYTYEDIYRYLKISESKLNVNQFTLTARIELFRNHSYFRVYAMRRDISNKIEHMPIQAINQVEPKFYPDFIYIKENEFTIDSELLKSFLNEDELKCCNCEDCSDIAKCECRQMTILENRLINLDNESGYEFNYLTHLPKTAIYECNSKCKCKRNCLNRVVQNGIKVRLQVYKTSNRGWGVRTLHDIPKGTFICTYTGRIVKNLRTKSELNNLYLMNLSYKYCYDELKNKVKESGQENLKNKFNSVPDSLDQRNDSVNDLALDKKDFETKNSNDNDEDYGYTNIHDLTDSADLYSNESSSSFSDLTDTDISDSSLSDCLNLKDHLNKLDNLNESEDDLNDKNIDNIYESKNSKKDLEKDLTEDYLNESMRKKFKKNQDPKEPNQILDSDYLIDSREYGNVSRFLNHSCNPNLATQPVFIDSQNPLFTNLAFFAIKDVKAYKELTFDYFLACDQDHRRLFNCKCKSKKCISKLT